MPFARIEDGLVVELFTPPEGVDIADCFHEGLTWIDISNIDPAPDIGWSATQGDGDAWSFAPPAAPEATPEQHVADRIAQGITITSTSTAAASAVYALDATTMEQIGSVARDDAAGLGLPGGAPSFTYPDASGTPHALSGPQVQALYKAQRDLLWALNTQAAVAERGGTPTWPPSTATIP
jgi:hypothetical protein